MNGTPEDDLSIDDLRTFVTAVEEGSLGSAARRLQQPKSTISRRLNRLEEQLGTRLLHRTPRGLGQTDAGRVALAPARAILEDLASLRELARAGMAEPRGHLKVSIPRDLAGLPCWMSFAQAHPQVVTEFEFTNRYVDVVNEGFDLALRGGRGEDATLIVRRLGTYRLRAVASPQWLEAHGPLESPEEVRQHECVLFAPFRQSGRRKRSAARQLIANDLSTVLDGALRGLGIAFLPDHLCADAVDRKRLIPVHPDYDPLEIPLYAAYPDRRSMPAALTTFIEAVAAYFGSDSRPALHLHSKP